MLATQPLISWLSVAVLVALTVRSLARLAVDRAASGRAQTDPTAPGCTLTSRVGEASHAAMALGMAAMVVVPATGDTSRVFEAYFGVNCALTAGTWSARAVRRKVARMRGTPPPCRPAHALEPHHVIIGLAMVLMAAQMSDAASPTASTPPMPEMPAMPGMTSSPTGLTTALAALALLYVWVAVVVLGSGLAKSTPTPSTAPAGTTGTVGLALLSAPRTVYACELTMTVIMGLMLLG
jgi:uncharacterized protein DUF5134